MIIKFDPHGFVVFLTLAMGMVYAVFNSRRSWGFWKIAIVGVIVVPFLYYGFAVGRVVEIVMGSFVGLLVVVRGPQSPAWYDHLRLFLSNPRLYFRLMEALKLDDEPEHTETHKPDDVGGGWNHSAEEEAKRRQRQAQEEREKQSEQSESEQTSQAEEPQGDSSSSSREKPGGNTKQDIGPLNPTNLDDAFKILGLEKGASLGECKQAYRTLISIYNSDKINRLSGHRKAQAEEEAKDINRAWATIKKYYDARN